MAKKKVLKGTVKEVKDRYKPTVAVDLDGCLADYDGWKGIEHILRS